MKVLIVGLGSIAKKHINALQRIYSRVEIFALRSKKSTDEMLGVKNIFDFSDIPTDISFVIISNPTSEHYSTVVETLKLKRPIFLEKPSFINLNQADDILKLVRESRIAIYTAFNFRFHPAIVWLKENIDSYRVLEVQAYCGSYLPSWRLGVDYRYNYSAKKELGGGVHLDLIHEIDYLIWIFGEPLKSSLFLNKVSDLEINSIDSATYILEYCSKVVSIRLNYFRKDAKRTIEVVTDESTLFIDLLKNKIVDSNNEILFQSDEKVLETYFHQMKYFVNAITNGHLIMNDIDESTNTLKYALQNN
jgi:predicted dehydrogenase